MSGGVLRTLQTEHFSVATSVLDGGRSLTFTFTHIKTKRVVCIGSHAFDLERRLFVQECTYTEQVDRLGTAAFCQLQSYLHTIRSTFMEKVLENYPVYKDVGVDREKRIRVN